MKKAVVAVAHRLLTVVYLLIRDGGVYRERGGDFFDRQNPERTATKLTKRLEKIGYQAALKRTPLSPVAPAEVVPPEICSKCDRWRLGKCIHHQPRPKKPHKKITPAESTA